MGLVALRMFQDPVGWGGGQQGKGGRPALALFHAKRGKGNICTIKFSFFVTSCGQWERRHCAYVCIKICLSPGFYRDCRHVSWLAATTLFL